MVLCVLLRSLSLSRSPGREVYFPPCAVPVGPLVGRKVLCSSLLWLGRASQLHTELAKIVVAPRVELTRTFGFRGLGFRV